MVNKMKFDKVKVGYKTYKFIEWEFDNTLETGRYGECAHVMHEIRYTPVSCQIELKNTILHEILHAICNVYDLELENEERVVTRMANAIQQVMQDNPEIFMYLNDTTEGG